MGTKRNGSNAGLNTSITRQQLKPRRHPSAQALLANAKYLAEKASKLTPAEKELLATRQARRNGQPPPG
jgi:hypothetical protein